ncbi:MAG: protein kinase domain-containing protein [Nannocystaceae bacterium]|nr:serine/threonine-protein kinase [bacterium]
MSIETHGSRGLSGIKPLVDELEVARLQDKLRVELLGIETTPPRLGRFVVVDRLGAGAMGVVYAAYDPQLDRRVAIKVLHASQDDDDSTNARLVREARALAKLDHPNVVTVHEVGTFEGRVFVAMEYVEGTTLTQWLTPSRSVLEVLRAFGLAGLGLAAAHAKGVVHRDFKPDNVLVGEDDAGRLRVCVADFGLARSGAQSVEPLTTLETEGPLLATKTGTVLGTPAYMAPEQHRGEPATPASDQFAFCVALFEALVGRRPFEGPTRLALLESIETGRMVDFESTRGRVPAGVSRAVQRGLQNEPQRRWPSIDALLAQLERDPRGRRRWSAVSAVSLGALGVGLWARGTADDPCASPREALSAAYDSSDAKTIVDAFGVSGVPAGAEIGGELRDRLDAYSTAWWTQREQVCEPQQDAEIRTAICLDAELAAFAALVRIFQTPDEALVGDALTLAPDVAELQQCSGVGFVESARPDAELSGLLAEAKALSLAGRREDGIQRANEALAAARASANVASQAQALVRLARADLGRQRPADALELLDQASLLAEQAGDDVTRADALRVRVAVLHRLDRVDEAREVAQLAAAALQRFPRRPVNWDIELDRLRGELAESADDPQTALIHYQRGLERSDEGTVSPIVRIELLSRMSGVEYRRREFERSLALEEEVRAELRAAYGETHPAVATSWISTGASNYALRRLDEAEAAFRRALALRERNLSDPDDPSLAAVLTNLGGLLAVTHPEEAEVMLRRARRATIAGRGIEHPHVITVESNLVTLLEGRSRFDEAETVLREMLPRARAALGDDHPKVAKLEAMLGSILVARGDSVEAQPMLEGALATLDADAEANAEYLARPLCRLARLRLGDDARAAMTLAQRCHDVATDRGIIRWQVEAACTLVLAGRAGGSDEHEVSAWSREAHEGIDAPGVPPALSRWIRDESGC